MPYIVIPTKLLEVLILESKVFGDARGFLHGLDQRWSVAQQQDRKSS